MRVRPAILGRVVGAGRFGDRSGGGYGTAGGAQSRPPPAVSEARRVVAGISGAEDQQLLMQGAAAVMAPVYERPAPGRSGMRNRSRRSRVWRGRTDRGRTAMPRIPPTAAAAVAAACRRSRSSRHPLRRRRRTAPSRPRTGAPSTTLTRCDRRRGKPALRPAPLLHRRDRARRLPAAAGAFPYPEGTTFVGGRLRRGERGGQSMTGWRSGDDHADRSRDPAAEETRGCALLAAYRVPTGLIKTFDTSGRGARPLIFLQCHTQVEETDIRLFPAAGSGGPAPDTHKARSIGPLRVPILTARGPCSYRGRAIPMPRHCSIWGRTLSS